MIVISRLQIGRIGNERCAGRVYSLEGERIGRKSIPEGQVCIELVRGIGGSDPEWWIGYYPSGRAQGVRLGVENASTGADHGTAAELIRNTQARRPVILVELDESAAVETARNRGDQRSRNHRRRLVVGIDQLVGTEQEVRLLIVPLVWWRPDLIAQAQVQRKMRVAFPIVVNKPAVILVAQIADEDIGQRAAGGVA